MTRRPWLEFYPREVKENLEYPDIALTDLLLQAANDFPDRHAVYFFGAKMTYRELLESAYRFANALRSLGVDKGDRIALMLPNIPQYVIAYYGVLFLGGIVVQTNPLYMERELVHHLNDAQADTIVCLDLLYPRVSSVRDRVRLKRIIVTGIPEYLPFPKNVLYPLTQKRKGPKPRIDESDGGVFRMNRLLRKASPEPVRCETDPEEDIAVLQYTGGTTGTAKGVMLTHRNLIANVKQCEAWMYKAERGREVMLAAVPLFHVYGMTVCMNLTVSLAGMLVLIPKFETGTLLKTIHGVKPTMFPGAPTMYIAINNHPDIHRFDLSSIKCCISGSAPLPLEVQQKFESLTAGRLVEGFGLSESSPVTHANPIWGKRKTGSIGTPWPDTDCRIVDPDTREELPPGEVGELSVRGPQVMKGYWNRPAETESVLKDGWLHTGDMAYMDEDGYFYIVDRKKDMINAGGFKIFPREVEEVLFEHPAVLEAAVVGVPDEYRGETVKAFVVLKEGASVGQDELDRHCRGKLAAYKVPRIYEFRRELPKTIVGKVLRRALKEEDAASKRSNVPPDGPASK
jgi:long-chain acyl-CoA synthetase